MALSYFILRFLLFEMLFNAEESSERKTDSPAHAPAELEITLTTPVKSYRDIALLGVGKTTDRKSRRQNGSSIFAHESHRKKRAEDRATRLRTKKGYIEDATGLMRISDISFDGHSGMPIDATQIYEHRGHYCNSFHERPPAKLLRFL